MIDWFSIAFNAGPLLILTAGVSFVTDLVLALVVLVRWAVRERSSRAS